ncbi:glycosyltransferase family 4 protein [Sphingomonas daechungensis]|uniref:glycosyltransferase family 4 protein n=1 Tax=Sphingomonas daechungensis TaxID=1176646 RepID=UPI0037835C95
MSGKTVLILGSYAPSLVHFRGELIAAIAQRGHRVVAAAPQISAEIAEQLRARGAEPRELSLVNASLNPFAMLQSFRDVRRLIREVRPDALIAYTIKPVVLGALAGHAERVPTIVSLITGLGYAFTGGRELKRLLSRSIAGPLYRLALARSTEIIFQNSDDEALFRQLGLTGDRATHVVSGSGIDIDHFSLTPLPERASFLMIARLLRDKGIREFAEAAKKLKAEHPDVPINLVGYLDPSPDSLTQAELDELVRKGVDFKGALADVRPAMAECSVYVLPSYREGTPRSVLEAMAMGRAIITTDAPGCRETVEDGKNGILVAPRQADPLYLAMSRFVAEPGLAAQMGSQSRIIAEQKYDVRKVNADMIRIAGL